MRSFLPSSRRYSTHSGECGQDSRDPPGPIRRRVPYSSLTRIVRRLDLREDKKEHRSGTYEFGPGQEMQHDTSPHSVLLSGNKVKAQCAGLVLAYWQKTINPSIIRRSHDSRPESFATRPFSSWTVPVPAVSSTTPASLWPTQRPGGRDCP